MFAALLLAPLLTFHGNVALLEDVYRSFLDLPASTKATPANARMVATRLTSFLHRAGYALATVRARADGDQIVVDVDEGRLDKVIFLSGGAFETLRLRLDLNIQYDVFNQPDLELTSVQGGAIGATYHSGRLISREDRWNLGARVAGALRQRLDQTKTTFSFTGALAQGEYEAPPIAGVLRPSIHASAGLTDQQRPDLSLESFMFARIEGGVDLLLLPIPQVHAAIGAGVERRILYQVEPLSTVTNPPFGASYSFAQNRPYAEVRLELVFDPEALRRDRHHLLG